MSTAIYYNGQALPAPLPLVAREDGIIRVGEKFAIREIYRLNGRLISCDGLAALLNSGTALINIFNKDFQEFAVQENGIDVIRKSGVVVESIDFGDSSYAGSVPYTVSLACYPSALQNVFGVLDPVDQWSFDEQQNGLVKIVHNVGARGYNTFQNAVDFVQARTGFSNAPAAQFLNLTGTFVLDSQQESIDRFNGTYSITENFTTDLRSSGLTTRYTFQLQSGIEGFIQASIDGNVDGGLNNDLASVRSRYAALNVGQICQTLYSQATDLSDLNTTPLSSGVTENVFAQKLAFNVSFDNNPDAVVSLDRTITINSGDELTNVAVNGRIFGRGEHNARWAQVQSYFAGVDIFGLAQSGYNYYGGSYALNSKPVASGATFNQFNSEIVFNAEFNDRDTPPAGFQSFEVRAGFQPALRRITNRQLAANENPDESFFITDLGYYPKVQLSIEGQGVLDENVPIENGKQLVVNEVQRLLYIYGGTNMALETKEIRSNPNFGRALSFNFSWVMDSPRRVNFEPRWDLVADLQVK